MALTQGLAALCLLGLVAWASAGCVVDGDITCYTDVQSRILDPNNVSAGNTRSVGGAWCVCSCMVPAWNMGENAGGERE
jgi:hypothetical protein